MANRTPGLPPGLKAYVMFEPASPSVPSAVIPTVAPATASSAIVLASASLSASVGENSSTPVMAMLNDLVWTSLLPSGSVDVARTVMVCEVLSS